MVIALAVFVLLYLFTSSLSLAFATVASVLLVVHVFIASHLALGVIKHVIDLPWYPHEPLSDPTAWIQVAGVGVALASRNLLLAGAS
jgi:hypothetical protein